MKLTIPLAILLISSLCACRRAAIETSTPEIARIREAEVYFEKMGFPVRTSGLIVSAKEIKLSFKTGGIIDAIYADDGTRVKQGTLLASLDPAEIGAQVEQATNGYDKARRDYVRAKNLYTDSVATLEQLQNAETAMNVAKATLDAVTFNRNHSKIFAPDDGVILKRLVEAHEVIASGYPVFLFGTTGKHWKIRAGLADRNYVRIKQGDSAIVTLDAYPGEKFKAIISQMGEAANPLTGTYEVELDMLPVTKQLASGFIANLEIIPSCAEPYYRIPVEAVIEGEGQTGYVFTITDSATAKKLKVTIAGIFDNWAAVSAGLEGVEKVATEGAAYLTDGERVTVIR